MNYGQKKALNSSITAMLILILTRIKEKSWNKVWNKHKRVE